MVNFHLDCSNAIYSLSSEHVTFGRRVAQFDRQVTRRFVGRIPMRVGVVAETPRSG